MIMDITSGKFQNSFAVELAKQQVRRQPVSAELELL
jgi:hypothetical protein